MLFTVYRLAKKEAYLQTARRLADYYLGRLPPSYIVPWYVSLPSPMLKFLSMLTVVHRDFDSPEQFADASGAMVAAAGLVMLANEETSRANKARYYGAAQKASFFLSRLPLLLRLCGVLVRIHRHCGPCFSFASFPTMLSLSLVDSRSDTAFLQLLKATSDFAWSPTWQSLLSNGTVNHPANNQLTGIVYGTSSSYLSLCMYVLTLVLGDYYYVLAGNELVKAGQAKC